MFELLRRVLKDHESATDQSAAESYAVASAAGALMIEVAFADHELTAEEKRHVRVSLELLFGIESTQAGRLVGESTARHASATDLFGFTRTLNEHLDGDEKQALLIQLWRLHDHAGETFHREEHVIRRISDLLYLSHAEFIAAKLAARNATNP